MKDLVVNALELGAPHRRELRPPALDDSGVIAALGRLAETTTCDDHQVGLVAVFTNDTRLPKPVDTTTYRIIQEAVTRASQTRRSQHHHYQ